MANRIMIQMQQRNRNANQQTITATANPAPPPGADAGLTAEDAAAVRETELHNISRDTVRDHNNRITKIIKFIHAKYPDKYNTMTRELTNEEKAQPQIYHKSTRDFIYPLIDIEVIKAYICSNKIKSIDNEGKQIFYGWDNMRKYHDSILFGASRSRSQLPQGYRAQMKKLLDALKKENQQKKRFGQVDEHEAEYAILC